MNPNDLEFLISQYADGTLEPEQAAALEARLREDAGARALLADHRRVTALLAESSALPAVNWDRLANAISDGLDRAEAQRIEQRFRLPFGRIVAGAAAVAACMIVGLIVFRDNKATTPTNRITAAKVIEISLPTAAVASAPRVVEVSIGSPLDRSAVASIDWNDLQPRSVRIVVAAGDPPVAPDALDGY